MRILRANMLGGAQKAFGCLGQLPRVLEDMLSQAKGKPVAEKRGHHGWMEQEEEEEDEEQDEGGEEEEEDKK